MDPSLYQDSAITITATEIRSRNLTVYLRNVTSVSITTIRPGKWAPLGLVPMVATVLTINFLFAPLVKIPTMILLPMLPLLIGVGVYFLLRVSRLYLQTAGGPVVLAHSLSLTEPTEALKRYGRIKAAIEKAVSTQNLLKHA